MVILEITAGKNGVEDIITRAKDEKKFFLLTHSIQGCGPCVQLGKLLKKFEVEFKDTVIFAKMMAEDTPENEAWVEEHNIEGYPWLYLYDPSGTLVCDDMPFNTMLKNKLLEITSAGG